MEITTQEQTVTLMPEETARLRYLLSSDFQEDLEQRLKQVRGLTPAEEHHLDRWMRWAPITWGSVGIGIGVFFAILIVSAGLAANQGG